MGMGWTGFSPYKSQFTGPYTWLIIQINEICKSSDGMKF